MFTPYANLWVSEEKHVLQTSSVICTVVDLSFDTLLKNSACLLTWCVPARGCTFQAQIIMFNSHCLNEASLSTCMNCLFRQPIAGKARLPRCMAMHQLELLIGELDVSCALMWGNVICRLLMKWHRKSMRPPGDENTSPKLMLLSVACQAFGSSIHLYLLR